MRSARWSRGAAGSPVLWAVIDVNGLAPTSDASPGRAAERGGPEGLGHGGVRGVAGGDPTVDKVEPEPVVRDLERVVTALRGMAYEHRFRILVLLMADHEVSPADMAQALPLEATVVAHHLRHLLDAKLIRRQRRGRRVFYALSDESTRRLVGEVIRYAGGGQ
jgi:DNA-binding transcriptional ArsR family regulator